MCYRHGMRQITLPILMHFFHPNLSDNTRASFSCNVMLKWLDDYFPEQK